MSLLTPELREARIRRRDRDHGYVGDRSAGGYATTRLVTKKPDGSWRDIDDRRIDSKEPLFAFPEAAIAYARRRWRCF